MAKSWSTHTHGCTRNAEAGTGGASVIHGIADERAVVATYLGRDTSHLHTVPDWKYYDVPDSIRVYTTTHLQLTYVGYVISLIEPQP